MSHAPANASVGPDLLGYLACPRCGGDLELEGEGRTTGAVGSGRLVCASGCGSFPVQDGVPRLLPEFCDAPDAGRFGLRRTRRSFGAQWRMYRDGATTWGITVEERVRVVLHELEWTESDLEGKVILDAGCGNGTLSAALAERGATVVALDLSDSVFRAHRSLSRPGLHFVQANLFYPPLRPGRFDAIYSCGVFHHTPDTRRCFDALVPSLKPEPDARYFVWLYAPRSRLFNLTVEQLMKVTRRMPDRLLVPACFALAPPVELASRALTALGAVRYGRRTIGDRAIQLHDLLSPPYVDYLAYDDVHSWALDAGFRDVKRTDYEPGPGVTREDAGILRRYSSLCRPGFGMLCRGPARPASVASGRRTEGGGARSPA